MITAIGGTVHQVCLIVWSVTCPNVTAADGDLAAYMQADRDADLCRQSVGVDDESGVIHQLASTAKMALCIIVKSLLPY